jgi:fluoride ion exporter CrcB/FEX
VPVLAGAFFGGRFSFFADGFVFLCGAVCGVCGGFPACSAFAHDVHAMHDIVGMHVIVDFSLRRRGLSIIFVGFFWGSFV